MQRRLELGTKNRSSDQDPTSTRTTVYTDFAIGGGTQSLSSAVKL